MQESIVLGRDMWVSLGLGSKAKTQVKREREREREFCVCSFVGLGSIKEGMHKSMLTTTKKATTTTITIISCFPAL